MCYLVEDWVLRNTLAISGFSESSSDFKDEYNGTKKAEIVGRALPLEKEGFSH